MRGYTMIQQAGPVRVCPTSPPPRSPVLSVRPQGPVPHSLATSQGVIYITTGATVSKAEAWCLLIHADASLSLSRRHMIHEMRAGGRGTGR